MKKTIFSGIQPSGNLHIGNYIGAIKQWVELQNFLTDSDLIFCIVDLHAITVKQDPKELRKKNREVAALFIAAGIDPKKSKIFIQSENPDHPYLGWILNCYTPFGQLERMTQFKDKSTRLRERSGEASKQDSVTAGLFDYPVLMAADILLYDTDEVPVGEDQKQHIELTRDIAEKFNNQYGEVFKLPAPRIIKETARIMSLQNPMSKMSKSDENPGGAINLLDSKDVVADKIKRAVTDSGSEIAYQADKPAISNLLAIYSRVTDTSIQDLEKKYQGVGYGVFKKELSEAVIEFLEKFQSRYNELMTEDGNLDTILDEGAEFTRSRSAKKVQQVKDAVGLGR